MDISLILWFIGGFTLMYLMKRGEAWKGGLWGVHYALMKRTMEIPGFLFSLHPGKRTFRKGEIYRVTDKDWLGRNTFELEYSDHWIGPDDFDFVSRADYEASR